MKRIKTAVITGPTATGKTRLAVELALKLGGEVVSADSMQIYRGMDIGTAKPTQSEMKGVPHHMIDVAEPDENYSVARYVEEASRCIEEIASRGKLPIIAGGTGLYIDALVSGRDFAGGGENPKLRATLSERYDQEGGEGMLRLLRSYDPESAEKLHANDKKRIVRALEVILETGKTISEHNRETRLLPVRYESAKIALCFSSRDALYSRTDLRVDEMISRGLVSEVRGLLDRGISPEKHTSMQAIGYKEIVSYLREEISLEEAVQTIKRETRRYSKRQLTWLRRDEHICWIDWKDDPDFDVACLISTKFLIDNGIISA